MIKKIILIVSFLVVCSGASFSDTEEKKYVQDLVSGQKMANTKL